VRLSKSKFIVGLQCDRRLWWTVHEREAPELEVDAGQQALFDHGSEVGEVARSYFADGVLIDLPHYAVKERVTETRRAIAGGASVIYEASFLADDVFVAVDVLHRRRGRWTLTEVKSTTKLKPEHIPDAAIQTHVLRRAGLDVGRTEVMHLNRGCRHPDLDTLFTRVNVTRPVEQKLPEIPREVRRQLRVLGRPLPDVEIGDQCARPYECPFAARCQPEAPEHHISALYRIGHKQLDRLIAEGFESIHDLPEEIELAPIADRQRRAVQSGALVIEPSLRDALSGLEGPIAYLDFETLALPIPIWPGCRPYDAVPVQLSCHVDDGRGGLRHHEWLADGPADPRRGLAEALIEAVAGAKTILAYNAGFEVGCIQGLREALPHLASPLRKLERRVQDLLPIVREHVYHPAFGGGFGLKRVLPALVPELSHDDLAIQDGGAASAELERLLLHGTEMSKREKSELRRALLDYCRLDTLGMVKILERLRSLALGQRRKGASSRGSSRRVFR
jgi:hypothetical protein